MLGVCLRGTLQTHKGSIVHRSAPRSDADGKSNEKRACSPLDGESKKLHAAEQMMHREPRKRNEEINGSSQIVRQNYGNTNVALTKAFRSDARRARKLALTRK